jgi:hypothetical protein
MNTEVKLTREEIYAKLEQQYKNNFAGCLYPEEFKAQGYKSECNFGGLLVILSFCGDSVVVWSDWSDTAVSEELTECEIDYSYNEETDENEAYFTYQGSRIDLYDILAIQ